MRTPSLRRLPAAVAVAALISTGAVSAEAQTKETGDPKPTVVLVHGAFADASGFNGVISRLQKAGFPVIAPANPLRDTADDAAYISSVLDTLPGPVILAAHSYGGIVTSNAARGHANVKALVYLGAFAPDKGESVLQLAERFPGSELGSALVQRPYPPLPDGRPTVDGYIDPARFRAVFAADLPASQTRLMPPPSGPAASTASRAPAAPRRGRPSRPGTSSRPGTRSSRRPPSGSWPSAPEARSLRSSRPMLS
ncbi:alpha/beta hydrolase [Streptomyces europaeiscabiei]